jgi:pre-rRNA-processing protein TSR3
MQLFPPTVVLRHRRENLKKCSLRGLESRPDFLFFSYPSEVSKLEVSGYIMLALEAPLLTVEDADKGLLIIDGTWRYAEKMASCLLPNPTLIFRSIPPHFRTAYPRRQEDCSNPERGLASVEALYIAYKILRREAIYLLDSYYWKDKFLDINNKYIDF